MYKTSKHAAFILLFIFLTLALSKSSHGFLLDEIVGSVNNIPITMNEVQFFNIINQIDNSQNGSLGGLNHNISGKYLKKNLDAYINRLLVLRQEKKFGGVTISQTMLDNYTVNFKKKFKIFNKNMLFPAFLEKYGYNDAAFSKYIKNILYEKKFIAERLHFFLYTSDNGVNILNNGSGFKKIPKKVLLADLKKWINRLRKRAKVEINLQ